MNLKHGCEARKTYKTTMEEKGSQSFRVIILGRKTFLMVLRNLPSRNTIKVKKKFKLLI